MTRKQAYITKYLIDEIKNINDINKLKYIYFEIFKKTQDVSKSKLISLINTNWDDKYYKIYDFFKSISMNKN